jgi:hypothetical protein
MSNYNYTNSEDSDDFSDVETIDESPNEIIIQELDSNSDSEESDGDSDNISEMSENTDIASDDDNEMDSFVDSDQELIYENIFRDDSEHLYVDREHDHYYIGIQKYMRFRNVSLLINSVSARTFFQHTYHNILRYLFYYSIVHVKNPVIEIMKLQIMPDESYSVIRKTYWLRLVQRHWKKVFRERNAIINRRYMARARFMHETSGRYPYGLNSLPTIHGMLSCYQNKILQ